MKKICFNHSNYICTVFYRLLKERNRSSTEYNSGKEEKNNKKEEITIEPGYGGDGGEIIDSGIQLKPAGE